MGDGRGGFVAAGIFGLVVTIGGLGIAIGSGYRFAPEYPAYISTTVNADRKIAQDIKRPCVKMISRDESDLCAQWKAANAANYGAIWSFAQALLSAAGIIGLIATLLYNRRALVATDQTSKDSRRIGEAQVRAYLDVDDVSVIITGDGMAEVGLSITNSGQSPARSVVVESDVILLALGKDLQEEYGCASALQISSVPSGQSATVSKHSTKRGLTKNMADFLDDPLVNMNIWVKITIDYEDVFRKNAKIVRTYSTRMKIKRGVALRMVRPDELGAAIQAEIARRRHVSTQ